MKKLKLFFTLILVSFFSCQKSAEKTIPVLELKELIVDTLYLEKDDSTKHLGSNFTFSENSGNSVLRTFILHTFYEYSFPEGKLIRKQKYEKEGPDGVGDFISGSFIDENSIWLINSNKLLEVDFSGKIKNRYQLPFISENRPAINYSTLIGSEIFKVGEELLIPDVPYIINDQTLNYSDWILRFNPTTNESNYISFKFPKEYQELKNDPNFGPYQNAYNAQKSEMVISFAASDSILVLKGREGIWKDASVGETMTFLPGTPIQNGEWIAFYSNPETSKYGNFYFDSFSKVYIRVAIVNQDSEENRKMGKKPLAKLLVLDENLEKLAEIILPFPSFGFGTPEGYYFSIGYPSGEDLVGFARLDFSKIKA